MTFGSDQLSAGEQKLRRLRRGLETIILKSKKRWKRESLVFELCVQTGNWLVRTLSVPKAQLYILLQAGPKLT